MATQRLSKSSQKNNADVNKAAKSGITPIWIASRYGHMEIVEILAEKNADVDMADKYGRTPFWIAAERGFTKIVEILAEKNADVNKANDKGAAPIYKAAAERGHTEIVKLFLGEKNADVTKAAETNGRTLICKVDDGTSPLYKAAQYGHKEIVKILAEKNVDVNNPTNSGETPLQIAKEKGHSDIVLFLKKLRHKKLWKMILSFIFFGVIAFVSVCVILMI